MSSISKEYKLSNYNFYWQSGNNLRILNGLTRAVIELKKTNFYSLFSKFESLSISNIDFLIENNFLVPRNKNEFISYLSEFYKKRFEENIISLTVGLTFKCNFNCLYCIQKGNYNTKTTLTNDKIDKIINWIAVPIKMRNHSLQINYFGGEPTLNINRLFYFSERLNELASNYKTDIFYQMVTNGFALKKKTINNLINNGIRDYQITLDGLKDEHNKRRSIKYDSFSKIVENIILLVEAGATVNLLHVYDKSNLKSAINLIDFFYDLSKLHKSIKNRIRFNFAPTIPKQNVFVSCNHFVKGYETFLSKIGVEAYSYAKKKGFTCVNFLDIGCCFRQARNSVLIAPDLKLYKCYSVFGNEQYSICDISTPYDSFLKLAEPFSLANGISNKCKDCRVVTFCRGGCQFAASEKNKGEYGHPQCEDNTIAENIVGYLREMIF